MTESMAQIERVKAAPPGCPCCGGVLVPLRGVVRCQRCQWTMCFGCESPAADEAGDDDLSRR